MKLFLSFVMLLTTSCFAKDQVEPLVKAIAKAEGFGIKNTIPTRCKNPGDIKALKRYRFPGQVGTHKGYVVFKNEKAGWEALRHQIEKIVAGESRYSVNMTLKQLGKRYAESSIWPRVVATYLGVEPNVYLWEILGVPPALESKQ